VHTVKTRTSRTFSVAVPAVAVVVTGLSIAQAVRQDSFDPVVMIAWIPAVLIGASYRRPASGRSCSDGFLRRSQA
jgi:hypothetical protein